MSCHQHHHKYNWAEVRLCKTIPSLPELGPFCTQGLKRTCKKGGEEGGHTSSCKNRKAQRCKVLGSNSCYIIFSFLSSRDKTLIKFHSKRYEPFFDFRRALLGFCVTFHYFINMIIFWFLTFRKFRPLLVECTAVLHIPTPNLPPPPSSFSCNTRPETRFHRHKTCIDDSLINSRNFVLYNQNSTAYWSAV